MNTKFNPENDIIFTIDQKIRNKQLGITQIAVQAESASAAPNSAAPSGPPSTKGVEQQQQQQQQQQARAAVAPVAPAVIPSLENMSLVFFEFQVPIFAQWCQQNANGLRRPYQLVTDLTVLTSELKKKIPIALFLPFSVAPKAMEQLVGQISSKFQHVKLVLIALEPWGTDRIKEIQTKYQTPPHTISFAVWPMGVLSVEEILKTN
ncbi:MAG: hypothetical protein QE271_05060 [Bacteriovoracaceae bacterium]|nr:hypothetical protein [Bacteriovoracaceae bacterium]